MLPFSATLKERIENLHLSMHELPHYNGPGAIDLNAVDAAMHEFTRWTDSSLEEFEEIQRQVENVGESHKLAARRWKQQVRGYQRLSMTLVAFLSGYEGYLEQAAPLGGALPLVRKCIAALRELDKGNVDSVEWPDTLGKDWPMDEEETEEEDDSQT